MGTKLNKVPTNEEELNKLLQDIFLLAKSNYENDKESNFTGILEIIASEPNIITAIHKIKANKGSHTAGVDDKDIDDYLKNGKWVNRVSPEKERFQRKMKDLSREIFYVRKTSTLDRERLIQNIIRVNSIIVGLINYYSMCDQISVVIRKYAWLLKYTAYKSLKRYGGKWIRANEVSNLIGLHYGHLAHIPAVKYKEMYIGITDINFAKWDNPRNKVQGENPFTPEGRELYSKRMRKKGLRMRTDEVNSTAYALAIRMSKHPLYNFEYFMNRPYTYNRDKGKCKICGGYLEPNEVHTHHVNKNLPMNQINKVKNLISVHRYCHDLIHSETEPTGLSEKTMKKLAKYRKQLN